MWYDDSLSCEVKVAGQHPIGGNYGEVINGTQDITKYFLDSSVTTWLWTSSDCALREGQFFKVIHFSFFFHFFTFFKNYFF